MATTYPRENLVGRQFNILTVEALAERRPPRGGDFWLCKCKCGNHATVSTGALMRGQKSCGCLGSRKTVGDRSRTHGRYSTPEYRIWAAMKRRCYTPSDSSYHKYGARGIQVCDRWHDFSNFYADMGPRPSLGHSLDRIKNALGYSPENCRWATRTEQSRNRRSARMLTLNGETHNMAEWEKRTGVDKRTIFARLERGWSDEDALTKPVRHRPDWKPRKQTA